MADEVKETVETTEAPVAEEVKAEAKPAAKGKGVNIDTEKLKGQALGFMGKVKDFFVTSPSKAKWVIIISLVLEALFAFGAGFVQGIVSLVLAALCGYGVFVSVGTKADAEEEKTEE